VLVNTEDMHRLADELRAKINSKIRSWAGVAEPTEAQEREVSPSFLLHQHAYCELCHRLPWCALSKQVLVAHMFPSPMMLSSFPTQFVHLLFIEIDQDGSGTIDKGEFRMMLRKLNLTYRYASRNASVERFGLFLRSINFWSADSPTLLLCNG
jgi:hypothetical protein